ncbi:MAG TPA: hypothetical protein VGG19_12000 [Tepidisphaeraceae bacterium]|jgi:hypothetical protein
MELLFDNAEELKEYLADRGISALAVKRVHPQVEEWGVLVKNSQRRKAMKTIPGGLVTFYSVGTWHGKSPRPHFDPDQMLELLMLFYSTRNRQ